MIFIIIKQNRCSFYSKSKEDNVARRGFVRTLRVQSNPILLISQAQQEK
jgi:hypothetical protein